MKKTSPSILRKKPSHPTAENPFTIPEDWYSTREYSVKDMLALFDFAKNLKVTNVDPFRMLEGTREQRNKILALIVLQDHHSVNEDAVLLQIWHDDNLRDEFTSRSIETIMGDAKLDTTEAEARFQKANPGVPLSQALLQIVVGDLIKTGFRRWRFLKEDQNNELKLMRDQFTQAVYDAFYFTKFEIQKHGEVSKRGITEFLLPNGEFKSPDLFYTIENIFIHLITNLTAKGWLQKAMVVHQFLVTIKRLAHLATQDSAAQRGIYALLASTLLSGFETNAKDILNEHKNESAESEMITFVGGLLNLSFQNRWFDFDYDPALYLILHGLEQKCIQKRIVSTRTFHDLGIPNLRVIDGEQSLLRINHVRCYNQIYKDSSREFFSHERAVLNYFVNFIKTQCLYHGTEQAHQAHLIIQELQTMYAQDASQNKDEKYGLALRHLFDLPSVTPEFDAKFDSIAARYLLGVPNIFKHKFMPSLFLGDVSPKQFSQLYQESEFTINELLQLKSEHLQLLAEKDQIIDNKNQDLERAQNAFERKKEKIAGLKKDLAIQKSEIEALRETIQALTLDSESATSKDEPHSRKGLHFWHHREKADKETSPKLSHKPPKRGMSDSALKYEANKKK